MKTHFYSQLCRSILDTKYMPNLWAKCYYSSQSHYDLLNISPNASKSQIKAAYFRLSKKYHPDVNKGEDAKLNFNRISEAYKILINTGQRNEYDRQISHTKQSDFKSSFDGDGSVYRNTRISKVKRNSSKPHTGKTAHFDFDEFYRNHYPEMIKKAHESKIRNERYEQDMKEILNEEKSLLVLKLGILFMILLFIIAMG